MDRLEILEKVKGIIAEELGVEKDELTEKTSYIDDLNADSLDTVEILMELESVFEISIPDEDVPNIRTIGDTVDYVYKKRMKE